MIDHARPIVRLVTKWLKQGDNTLGNRCSNHIRGTVKLAGVLEPYNFPTSNNFISPTVPACQRSNKSNRAKPVIPVRSIGPAGYAITFITEIMLLVNWFLGSRYHGPAKTRDRSSAFLQ